MKYKADLHLHTNCSDGAHHPYEVVRRAKKAGLNTISITDHDSVAGVENAIMFGKEIGVEVIPGVEISTDIQNREIHLLGYFVDHTNTNFKNYLEFFKEERLNRAIRIIKKLNALDFKVSLEDVLEIAKDSAVGRPHIAQTLVEKGYTKNIWEAFDKYLGNDCPAYEKKIHVSLQSALKIINEAGGLSVIAHPCDLDESILQQLIEFGLDGIEVIHPSHNRAKRKYYRGIVNEYYLLESGGSDYHGGSKNDDRNLGNHFISLEKVEAMKKRLIRG